MNFGISALRRRQHPVGDPRKLVKAFQFLEEQQHDIAAPTAAPDVEPAVNDDELGPLAKLPPFRPVVISVLRMLDRDDVDLTEVARMMQSDPATMAELLALVNSPLFGVQGTVSDAGHAVSLVGIDRTRALITTLAMRAMMANAPRTPVVRRFWTHSIATALIARELAEPCGVHSDMAYTGAVMHDLGRMGLLAAHTDSYTALAVSAWENIADILTAEREQFGHDHCEAGALLAKAWGLPDVLRNVVEQHHRLPDGRDVIALIQLSCRLADDFMFQSILHRTPLKPAETLEACAPAQLRATLAARLAGLQANVMEALQTLDF